MDFSTLNPQQKLAVQAPHAPLLIVAGAGTGKTKTLTSRLAHLIESGVPPEHICALTFTNKAAKEMVGWVNRILSGRLRGTRAPFIGTFHSLGARILRAEAQHINRTAAFTIFDDNDTISAVKKIVKEMNLAREKPAQLVGTISFLKSAAADATLVLHGKKNAARDVFARYEAFLERANALDFDDLIQKVVWLFRHDARILAKYQHKFSHVLVDEYQDINPAQYDLVKLLAKAHRRISVVGDDAQMIYGWRYATLDTFLDFEKEWPDARVILLEENYRSTSTIVEASSALIAKNERARRKNLWTKNAAGDRIAIVETRDEDEEAAWVARQIEERLAAENSREDSNVAVLYRTNAQSRAIEQALIERGIAYRIFGGTKFYERREIKDIIAALRFAANPRDELSRERIERAFPKRIAAALIAAMHKQGAATPVKAIETFLETSNYFEYLERNFTNAEERRGNISELIHFAGAFSALTSFLEEVALIQATDTVGKSGATPAVRLSTIHLAKGLEFDAVFVVGCAEGLLPHARSMEKGDELEEERRLMYVAMTRARHSLALSFWGLPSRFLGEIPEEFTNVFQLTESDDGRREENDGTEIEW